MLIAQCLHRGQISGISAVRQRTDLSLQSLVYHLVHALLDPGIELSPAPHQEKEIEFKRRIAEPMFTMKIRKLAIPEMEYFKRPDRAPKVVRMDLDRGLRISLGEVGIKAARIIGYITRCRPRR